MILVLLLNSVSSELNQHIGALAVNRSDLAPLLVQASGQDHSRLVCIVLFHMENENQYRLNGETQHHVAYDPVRRAFVNVFARGALSAQLCFSGPDCMFALSAGSAWHGLARLQATVN